MHASPLVLLALAGFVRSHMHLEYPPTLKGANNPFTQGEPDPHLIYNYGCCGEPVPGPCKGHLDLVDTDEGQPVATWAPGQKVNFTLSGSSTTDVKGSTHDGGSCAVGFSTDKGKTFKLSTTYNGNCPHREEHGGGIDPSSQVFDFTVPADIPSGERTIFAWTWVNREREFNMGCAVVTIAGSGGSAASGSASDGSASGDSASGSSTSGDSTSASSTSPKQSSSSLPQPTESKSSSATWRPSKGKSSDVLVESDEAQDTSGQSTESAEYTLEGCTCACPYGTWSSACSCYDCESPSTKRHLVERKALEMHKRHLQNAEKLNVPVRRAESVSWNDRPEMLLSIDFPGASCQSKGDDYELEFPNPTGDVVEGDGDFPLAPPTCE